MIEAIASGSVKRYEAQSVDKGLGRGSVRGQVVTTRTEKVDVNLEFPLGYVNLEGYAPSSSHSPNPLGSIEGYLDADPDEIMADTWDVKIVGEWHDWVQQAHRYLTERPNESLVSCLEKFKNWEETNTEKIDVALRKVSGLDMADETHLDTMEWELLEVELRDLDGVNIPEGYN